MKKFDYYRLLIARVYNNETINLLTLNGVIELNKNNLHFYLKKVM